MMTVATSLIKSRNGRHPYRIAGPGQVLGLPATGAAQPYTSTVQALGECELAVINGKRLMNLLRRRLDLMLYIVTTLEGEVSRVRARSKVLTVTSLSNSH